jgi:hypothetical protein
LKIARLLFVLFLMIFFLAFTACSDNLPQSGCDCDVECECGDNCECDGNCDCGSEEACGGSKEASSGKETCG